MKLLLALVAINLTCSGVDGDTLGMSQLANVEQSRGLNKSKPVQFRPTGQSFGIAAEYVHSGQFIYQAPEPRRTAQLISRPAAAESRFQNVSSKDQAVSGAQFLSRLAWIESRNNNQAIGDGGKSLGAYQFSERAWEQVNQLRARQRLPLYEWQAAHDPEISWEYCLQYTGWLNRQLTFALRRSPSSAELLATYQIGFTGFKRRGFDLNRIPKSTRDAINKLP